MRQSPQQAHSDDSPPLNCSRCRGLMVAAFYMDLQDDTGQIQFPAHRCTSCGAVTDPVILHNRISARPNLLKGTRQRSFPRRVVGPASVTERRR